MSLESELGRIATAFERIATAMEAEGGSDSRKVLEAALPDIKKKMKKMDAKDMRPPEEVSAFIARVSKEEKEVADQGPLGPLPSLTPTTVPLEKLPVIEPPAPRDSQILPKNGQELLTLASDVASKLGDKVPAFTDWVRKMLLPRYQVQKLKEVADLDAPEAAQQIIVYAKKAGIEV